MSTTPSKYMTIARMKAEVKGVEFLRPGEKRIKGEIAITANRLKDATQDDITPKIATLRSLLDELEALMEQPAVCGCCGQEVAKHGD